MAILPPQLFLTPFSNPWERPSVGSASMGEAGEMQLGAQLKREQMAAQREQAAAELAMNQAKLGLQQQEVTGRNKYYEDQISARKEETGARTASARDKQVMALHAALTDAAAKYQTSKVEMIRQQLGAMGYATEEVSTDLAEPPPTLQGLGLPPDLLAAPPATKGVKPTKPLDENLKKAIGATIPDGPPTEDSPQPMPWDMPGLEGAPKKQRGGKFLIRDPKGNVVNEIDAPLDEANREKAVSEALDPFISDASNPEEKAAAIMARKAAIAASKIEGVTPDKAAEIGRTAYEKEMNRFFQEKRPGGAGTGGGGGSGTMSKQEQARVGAVSKDTLAIIDHIDKSQQLPEARKGMGVVSNMESALQNADRDGFSGGSALSQYMKSISGTAVNEAEVSRIMGGAGKASEWETKLNQYTNGGRLDPDLIRGLQGVASRARQVFEERLKHGVSAANGYIDAVPGLASKEERAQQKEAARAYLIGSPGPSVEGGTKGADAGKQKAIDEARKLLGK